MRLSALTSDPFALPSHGGDLGLAEARFGKPDKGWLDLSTGISPFPCTVPDLPAEVWQRLPGLADDLALREVAAAAYGVDDPDYLGPEHSSGGIPEQWKAQRLAAFL